MNEINFDAATEIAAHDCMLYAHQTDRQVHIYRSVLVRDTSAIYQPVAELIGDAELVHRVAVADPAMGFAEAEHLIYRLPAAEVAA